MGEYEILILNKNTLSLRTKELFSFKLDMQHLEIFKETFHPCAD